MKNKQSIAYFILIIAAFCFSCRATVKEKNKKNDPAGSISLHDGDERYIKIDTKESVVAWKGANVIGPNAHNGYVYISKGELMIENGELTGGAVEVDMNTIEDEGHGKNSGLVNHLKDTDFFDIKKFPIAVIAITGAESINNNDKKVMGNLTIKGITHPVSFPAKVEVNNGIAHANGRLVIDRTLWNVRYGSGKFYDSLVDKAMISDSIEFNISIVTKH